MRRSRLRVWSTVVFVVAVCLQARAAPAQVPAAGSRPTPSICEREGPAYAGGIQPIRFSGSGLGKPKKVRDVRPQYPEVPSTTLPKGGVWIGEVLLDTMGRVVHVWTLRAIPFNPAFPPFMVAITDAVKQWEFTAVRVHGEAVPACIIVTITVDWR